MIPNRVYFDLLRAVTRKRRGSITRLVNRLEQENDHLGPYVRLHVRSYFSSCAMDKPKGVYASVAAIFDIHECSPCRFGARDWRRFVPREFRRHRCRGQCWQGWYCYVSMTRNPVAMREINADGTPTGKGRSVYPSAIYQFRWCRLQAAIEDGNVPRYMAIAGTSIDRMCSSCFGRWRAPDSVYCDGCNDVRYRDWLYSTDTNRVPVGI